MNDAAVEEPYKCLQLRFPLIGSGSFSGCFSLHCVQHTDQHYHVCQQRSLCCKIVPLTFKNRADIVREIHAFQTLRHQGIIHVFEIRISQHYVFFIMEEGTLGSLHHFVKNMPENDDITAHLTWIRDLTRPIANAIQYIHDKEFLLRDVKMENLFVMPDAKTVKIGDLGFLLNFRNNHHQTWKNQQTVSPVSFIGTLEYMSPQSIKEQCLEFTSDVWSFGVCLFILLFRCYPFQGKSSEQLKKEILKCEWQTHIPSRCLRDPVYISILNLLQHIFVVDHQLRWTMAMVLDHSFYDETPSPIRHHPKLLLFDTRGSARVGIDKRKTMAASSQKTKTCK